jgi:hypothetical protein
MRKAQALPYFEQDNLCTFGTYEYFSRGNRKMVIAGYISVCVQLCCILVFTVFHYMLRLTWPSSSVYDSLHMLKGIYFAAFFSAFFHMVTLCMFSICVLFLSCYHSLFLLFPCVCVCLLALSLLFNIRRILHP